MSLSFDVGFGYIPRFTLTPLTTTVETGYIGVKVFPLFYNKVIVEWSIPASWGNCVFNVYKSETEDGPWNLITPGPVSNTNFVEDINANAYSKFHKSYYRVEVQLPSPDNRRIVSGVTSWENNRSGLMQIRATEITRRETILLDKFTGVDTLIFRRKYFGERCPRCYNNNVEKVMEDHCPVCLGTSFLGGYFPGILSKVCYEISPNNTQLGYSGKVEANQTSAWTVSNPEMMSLDLLLRVPDARIFRVQAINPTELQTVQVRQVMQIIELNKNLVENNLLLNLVDPKHYATTLTSTKTKSQPGYVI